MNSNFTKEDDSDSSSSNSEDLEGEHDLNTHEVEIGAWSDDDDDYDNNDTNNNNDDDNNEYSTNKNDYDNDTLTNITNTDSSSIDDDDDSDSASESSYDNNNGIYNNTNDSEDSENSIYGNDEIVNYKYEFYFSSDEEADPEKEIEVEQVLSENDDDEVEEEDSGVLDPDTSSYGSSRWETTEKTWEDLSYENSSVEGGDEMRSSSSSRDSKDLSGDLFTDHGSSLYNDLDSVDVSTVGTIESDDEDDNINENNSEESYIPSEEGDDGDDVISKSSSIISYESHRPALRDVEEVEDEMSMISSLSGMDYIASESERSINNEYIANDVDDMPPSQSYVITGSSGKDQKVVSKEGGGYIKAKVSSVRFDRKKSKPTNQNKKIDFLKHGNFCPLHRELGVSGDLKVIGKVPRSIRGAYVRNGPNAQFREPHWHCGDGMLHEIQFLDGGRVKYRNRYIRTTEYMIEKAEQRPVWSPGNTNEGGALTGLKQLWNMVKWKMWGALGVSGYVKTEEMPYFKNPANVSLTFHANRLLALSGVGVPYEIALPSLGTVNPVTFDEAWDFPFTAHPKHDPDTGHMIFFGYNPRVSSTLKYGVSDKEGNLIHSEDIHGIENPVIIHDFAVTSNHTVFMVLPLLFSYSNVQSKGTEFLFNKKALKARFGVIPRYGKAEDIRWFPIKPCFVYHVANTFEDRERQEITIIGCRWSSESFQKPIYNLECIHNEFSSSPPSSLYMWKIHLDKGNVEEKILFSQESIEFPRINELYNMKQNRYVYYIKQSKNIKGPLFDTLVKYDIIQQKVQFHRFGQRRYCGEPVFVSRDAWDSTLQEDDGYILILLFDSWTEVSELNIIDARKISRPPLARIILPQRIPFGYHGIFVSQEQILLQQKKPIIPLNSKIF